MVDAWFGDLGLPEYAACFVEEGYETIEDLGLLARSGESAIIEMIDICNQSVPKGKLSKHRFRRELILSLLDLFSNMKDQLAQEADSMGDLEFLLDELQRASIRRKKERKPSVTVNKLPTAHSGTCKNDDSDTQTTEIIMRDTPISATPVVESAKACQSPNSVAQSAQSASTAQDSSVGKATITPSKEPASKVRGESSEQLSMSPSESSTGTATPSPVSESGVPARGPLTRIKTAATAETPSKLALSSHSNPNATEGRSWVQGVRIKDQKQKRKQPQMQSFEDMKRNLLQSKSNLDTRVTTAPSTRTAFKPSASVRN